MTANSIDQLTEAQRACLRLVFTHHNSKEIAAIVGVSPSAIDKRIERAIQVLGVGTRFEAARRLHEHEHDQGRGHARSGDRDGSNDDGAIAGAPTDEPAAFDGPSAPGELREDGVSNGPRPAYERLPSEPIDVPIPPAAPPQLGQIEPWGLVRRFLGLSRRSGSMGAARNRVSVSDRIVRLIGLVGLIAVTSMALTNMAMTLTSLLRSNRDRGAPMHGTDTTGPMGRISMLKQRREATDKVTSDFLKAEAAVDQAAMLAASCVSTLLQQRIAANLPVGTGAAALQMVSQASLDIINARQRFVDAHRALVEVRAEIGMGQFYGYGDTAECPPNEGALRAEAPVRLAAVA